MNQKQGASEEKGSLDMEEENEDGWVVEVHKLLPQPEPKNS